jgi:uncharacterized protein YecT (DUF1311 family)
MSDTYDPTVHVAIAVAVLAIGLKPPVIHEAFTPLGCPKHPTSTLDYEGCAEQQILATDKKIDAKARAIFFELVPRERAGFVRGERAWLAYRKDSCAAEASKYAGGTLVGVIDAQCQAGRSKTHLGELTDMLKTLQSP